MLTKEQVRTWMRQRQLERTPLPDVEQLRRQLRRCAPSEAQDMRDGPSGMRRGAPAREAVAT